MQGMWEMGDICFLEARPLRDHVSLSPLPQLKVFESIVKTSIGIMSLDETKLIHIICL